MEEVTENIWNEIEAALGQDTLQILDDEYVRGHLVSLDGCGLPDISENELFAELGDPSSVMLSPPTTPPTTPPSLQQHILPAAEEEPPMTPGNVSHAQLVRYIAWISEREPFTSDAADLEHEKCHAEGACWNGYECWHLTVVARIVDRYPWFVRTPDMTAAFAHAWQDMSLFSRDAWSTRATRSRAIATEQARTCRSSNSDTAAWLREMIQLRLPIG